MASCRLRAVARDLARQFVDTCSAEGTIPTTRRFENSASSQASAVAEQSASPLTQPAGAGVPSATRSTPGSRGLFRDPDEDRRATTRPSRPTRQRDGGGPGYRTRAASAAGGISLTAHDRGGRRGRSRRSLLACCSTTGTACTGRASSRQAPRDARAPALVDTQARDARQDGPARGAARLAGAARAALQVAQPLDDEPGAHHRAPAEGRDGVPDEDEGRFIPDEETAP